MVILRLGVVATDAAGNTAHVSAPRITPGPRRTGDAGACRRRGASRAGRRQTATASRRERQLPVPAQRRPARHGRRRPGDACDADMDGDGYYNDGRARSTTARRSPTRISGQNPCNEDPDGDGSRPTATTASTPTTPTSTTTTSAYSTATRRATPVIATTTETASSTTSTTARSTRTPTRRMPTARARLPLRCRRHAERHSGPAAAGGRGRRRDRLDAQAARDRRSAAPRLATIEAGLVVRMRCSEACAVTVDASPPAVTLRKQLKLPRGRVAARGSAQLERAARHVRVRAVPQAVSAASGGRATTPHPPRRRRRPRRQQGRAVRGVTIGR